MSVAHVALEQLTALTTLTAYGELEQIKSIIQHDASDELLRMIDPFGASLTHIAAAEGHLNVLQYLFAHGVDVHHVNPHTQQTLWHIAAGAGHQHIIIFLLQNCQELLTALPHKDIHGLTACEWASRNGHDAVVTLLEAHEQQPAHTQHHAAQQDMSWTSFFHKHTQTNTNNQPADTTMQDVTAAAAASSSLSSSSSSSSAADATSTSRLLSSGWSDTTSSVSQDPQFINKLIK